MIPKIKIPKKAYPTIQIAKSILYLGESFPLKLIGKKILKDDYQTRSLKDEIASLRQAIEDLKTQDQELIEQGLVHLHLQDEIKPLKHIKNYFKILKNVIPSSYQKKYNVNKHFSSEAEANLEGTPDYYKRNFHFQIDGYGTKESAEIYDHQVDILFSGLSDAMRRTVLKPLSLRYEPTDHFRVLELGCGTGSATQWISKAYPNAEIIGVDLSEAYLNECRLKNLPNFTGLKMAAESLDFDDADFDVVCSVFLTHELPQKVITEIFKEAHRVLKDGGLIVTVDSLQSGDRPEYEEGLEVFPQEFHEPFFKAYTQTPLQKHYKKAGFKDIQQWLNIVKCVSGTKPLPTSKKS